jgi:sulfate-transporting ATPase
VLLLDEPTNDLDVDTLRALEEALVSTSPAARSSSAHDRWFLDRIATHILAFEGDSRQRWSGSRELRGVHRRTRSSGSAADADAAPDQVFVSMF